LITLTKLTSLYSPGRRRPENVTCAIPAITNPGHMSENVGALRGPLLDAEMRARLVRHVESMPGFNKAAEMACYRGTQFHGAVRSPSRPARRFVAAQLTAGAMGSVLGAIEDNEIDPVCCRNRHSRPGLIRSTAAVSGALPRTDGRFERPQLSYRTELSRP
jgi:hypothetical protein